MLQDGRECRRSHDSHDGLDCRGDGLRAESSLSGLRRAVQVGDDPGAFRIVSFIVVSGSLGLRIQGCLTIPREVALAACSSRAEAAALPR